MENKLVQIIKNQRQVVCPNERFLFEGQPGGKWLGTSYFYRLLKDNASEIEKRFEGQVFFVCPRTIVLQTDLFKDFMDQNNLWEFAYQTNDDQKIKKKFLEAEFNRKQKEELSSIIKIFDKPLAIRSSSLNEDAERVSFAGIFYSIFLPNNLESIEERNAQLQDAIKLVYMSQYLEKAKEFYNRFNVLWGDERMAVIIQEVAGREHLIKDKRIYYPELSFVSFSYNDYATDMVEPSSGFYRIALGLGVGTVELEHNVSIAVNTGRPNPIIGLTCREDIIRNSPQYFYAIDLSKKNNIINEQYDFLLKLPVGFLEQTIIERHGTYFDEDFLPSTFKIPGREYQYYIDFRKSITTNKIGINSVIAFLRDLLRENFEKDVDFEGAIDIIKQNEKEFYIFYPLQARFQVRNESSRKEKLSEVEENKILLQGKNALGKGEYVVNYIVYVEREFGELFRYSKEIGEEIREINTQLKKLGNKTKYLLITPGRFGTIEPSVGVSGDFSTISHAKGVIEIINNKRFVNSSQGTHFFEDIRGAGMAYLHTDKIKPSQKEKFFIFAKEFERKEHCAILKYETPLKLELDIFGNYILYFDER